MTEADPNSVHLARLQIRRMIAHHGADHMQLLLSSIARRQTRPPNMFGLPPETVLDLLNQEVAAYLKRLFDPITDTDNNNNPVTY